MRRAAVLGSPISHTRSPDLHRAAYAELGLDWTYDAIECNDRDFAAFFAGLDEQWRGLSLTMPLKEVVLDVVEDVDDRARRVHSANTVWRTADSSSWRATNTDIPGICSALGDVGVDRLERVRILGAGATARSAVAAVAEMGAVSIVVHARRPEAADEVVRLARDLGCSSRGADLDVQWGEDDLLISTLPADAGAPWAAALDADRIGHTALLDASYHPWPTPLAQAWARHAPVAPVASGRDMLLWQAVDQVRLMTGAVTDANLARVAQVMRSALSTDGSSP
ncbi:MAG: shikimate dehydrogenase [Actinomycetia bacterium]|nr:shikimate dehydrogenase [Candidatus Nanopelagicales bacterium]MCH9678883.1 shikimate dehydrogenase [Actinomycetes bacterium]MCH9787689.1 shikimate dehydrogenase [Actinomycetes bacterium]MCH9795815.1 shikimate dehydrogenase [Actinomycetes bacterium]MCH9850733.1 shikimate dehydrogenase [Actinomycetes bacterium]